MVIGKITNWISELNILEFGDSLIEKLIESGKVKTIADLYFLSVKDLEELDRMGKKSAKKCYDLLWAAKSVPLDIFIGGLSIPLIGSSTIRLLMAAGFDTMDKVKAVKLEQMENILGIGPMRAGSLFKGLQDNSSLIDNILKNGVEIKMQEVKDNSNSKLKSQIFVLTGKMENKRADLEAMVEENGGIVKGAVTAGVHYLVINDLESTSSKATAAKKHNTKLISENELLEMMK
jgi:DNA ligase (NAD+)